MKSQVLIALLLGGCASTPQLTSQAFKVQVVKQDSTLLAKCSVIGPIISVKAAVMPAQDVVDVAEADVREQAAVMGADTISITNIDADLGLKNKMTVQAVAFKCFK